MAVSTQISPITVEWTVQDFLGINTGGCKLSPVYRMTNQEFILKIHRFSGNTYFFMVALAKIITTSVTANIKIDFVDQSEQNIFTISRKITFNFHNIYQRIIAVILDDIKDFVTGSTLTVRCKFSEEGSPGYENCSTQTVALLFPGPPNKYLEKLSSDFERIYKNQADTDCVLKTTDGKFPAHRAILSARSKVFTAMFHHDTSERQTGEVNIEDVEGAILRDLIHYIYTGEIIGLTSDTAVRLYAAAEKYALLELRDACASFLSCNLTIENVCDTALLARTHAEDALESKIVPFIVDRFDEITESEEWENFLESNSVIASKYLTAALKSAIKR